MQGLKDTSSLASSANGDRVPFVNSFLNFKKKDSVIPQRPAEDKYRLKTFNSANYSVAKDGKLELVSDLLAQSDGASIRSDRRSLDDILEIQSQPPIDAPVDYGSDLWDAV